MASWEVDIFLYLANYFQFQDIFNNVLIFGQHY